MSRCAENWRGRIDRYRPKVYEDEYGNKSVVSRPPNLNSKTVACAQEISQNVILSNLRYINLDE